MHNCCLNPFLLKVCVIYPLPQISTKLLLRSVFCAVDNCSLELWHVFYGHTYCFNPPLETSNQTLHLAHNREPKENLVLAKNKIGNINHYLQRETIWSKWTKMKRWKNGEEEDEEQLQQNRTVESRCNILALEKEQYKKRFALLYFLVIDIWFDVFCTRYWNSVEFLKALKMWHICKHNENWVHPWSKSKHKENKFLKTSCKTL